MRRSLSSFLCFLLFSFVVPVAAHAEKRVALVIGIDSYSNLPKDEQLLKAQNDAVAVGKSLEGMQFEVISGVNLSRFEFNKKLQEFAQSLKPGDVAAFFFSGHGVQIQNANYLLPSDIPQFQSGDEELLKREAVSLDSILAMLEEKGTQINLVILDACRNNPFTSSKLKGAGGTRGLSRVDPPTGTFVMFSAGANQTALDRLSDSDPNPDSVYTRSLLPLLQRPNMTVQSIAKQIQVEVRDLAKTVGHIQIPAYYDQVVGEFILSSATPLPSGEQTTSSATHEVKPDKAEPGKKPEQQEAELSKKPEPEDTEPKKPVGDQRKRLGEVSYLECVRTNDLACYKQFLTDFFEHPRAAQVEKIIQTQIEFPLYQACAESKTPNDRMKNCQNYLDAFPGGKYGEQAQALLDEGKRAGTPALPPSIAPQQQQQPQQQGMTRLANVDLLGADIEPNGIKPVTLERCEVVCQNNEQCQAFTWVADKRWCWPKYGTGSAFQKAGVVSGIKPGVTRPSIQTSATKMDRMVGYDLQGGDIAGGGIRPFSLEQCESSCLDDDHCRAYTWVQDKQWCWPKSEFGTPRRRNGMISGRKL